MRYVEETFERHKKKGEKKLPLGVFPRQEEFTSFTHTLCLCLGKTEMSAMERKASLSKIT